MTIETFLHDQAFAQPLETVETAGSIRQPPGRPRRWLSQKSLYEEGP